MGEEAAVRARSVTKCFGDVIALDGVDLDLPAGEVHGLVGPNGAGKTTLLGLFLGLAAADSGHLELLGTPIQRTGGLPQGVAGFVDGPGLYPSLTARQNLAAVARLRGQGRHDVASFLDQVGLADVADDRVRGFSLGMRQRLGLAAALLTRPRLLVLDEPVNGLDPAAKRQVHQVIDALVERGGTVILSSHRMDDVAALCREVTLLAGGRAVFTGPVSKLLAEAGAVEYRLRTSAPATARAVAEQTPELDVLAGGSGAGPADPDVLTVRADVATLEHLVARLVVAGVGVRELSPVVSPLETAYLSLTGGVETPAGQAR